MINGDKYYVLSGLKQIVVDFFFLYCCSEISKEFPDAAALGQMYYDKNTDLLCVKCSVRIIARGGGGEERGEGGILYEAQIDPRAKLILCVSSQMCIARLGAHFTRV